jgi:hypothetical protein
MIFASVSVGHYLIIENDVVVAEVKRTFGWERGYYTAIGYNWVWRNGSAEEFFRGLPDLHHAYPMDNYPINERFNGPSWIPTKGFPCMGPIEAH